MFIKSLGACRKVGEHFQLGKFCLPSCWESSARLIYGPAHQRMLHPGLGSSFKAECLGQG